jgi:hypothetical protein
MEIQIMWGWLLFFVGIFIALWLIKVYGIKGVAKGIWKFMMKHSR